MSPELYWHDAVAVAHQCRAIEAVDSPMREAIEGNDVLRKGRAVKDDIKKTMHVGTNEIALEKQPPARGVDDPPDLDRARPRCLGDRIGPRRVDQRDDRVLEGR